MNNIVTDNNDNQMNDINSCNNVELNNEQTEGVSNSSSKIDELIDDDIIEDSSVDNKDKKSCNKSNSKSKKSSFWHHLFDGINALKSIGIIAVAIVAIWGMRHYFTQFSSGIRIADTPTIVKEIKKISELSVVTYVEDVIMKDTVYANHLVPSVSVDNAKTTLKNLFRSRNHTESLAMDTVRDQFILVQIGTGRVKAGFDLSKIQEQDIRVIDSIAFITLPKPEILDVIMNPSDITTFHNAYTGSWSDAEKSDIRSRLLEKGTKQLTAHALNNQILEKTVAQGENKLKSMFMVFGLKDVVIKVDY